jgi:nitrate reductase gamma subunit
VHVTILTPTAATKEASTKKPAHKLRYIAGGIIILVLIVVGIVLFVNRRRQRD